MVLVLVLVVAWNIGTLAHATLAPGTSPTSRSILLAWISYLGFSRSLKIMDRVGRKLAGKASAIKANESLWVRWCHLLRHLGIPLFLYPYAGRARR